MHQRASPRCHIPSESIRLPSRVGPRSNTKSNNDVTNQASSRHRLSDRTHDQQMGQRMQANHSETLVPIGLFSSSPMTSYTASKRVQPIDSFNHQNHKVHATAKMHPSTKSFGIPEPMKMNEHSNSRPTYPTPRQLSDRQSARPRDALSARTAMPCNVQQMETFQLNVPFNSLKSNVFMPSTLPTNGSPQINWDYLQASRHSTLRPQHNYQSPSAVKYPYPTGPLASNPLSPIKARAESHRTMTLLGHDSGTPSRFSPSKRLPGIVTAGSPMGDYAHDSPSKVFQYHHPPTQAAKLITQTTEHLIHSTDSHTYSSPSIHKPFVGNTTTTNVTNFPVPSAPATPANQKVVVLAEIAGQADGTGDLREALLPSDVPQTPLPATAVRGTKVIIVDQGYSVLVSPYRSLNVSAWRLPSAINEASLSFEMLESKSVGKQIKLSSANQEVSKISMPFQLQNPYLRVSLFQSGKSNGVWTVDLAALLSTKRRQFSGYLANQVGLLFAFSEAELQKTPPRIETLCPPQTLPLSQSDDVSDGSSPIMQSAKMTSRLLKSAQRLAGNVATTSAARFGSFRLVVKKLEGIQFASNDPNLEVGCRVDYAGSKIRFLAPAASLFKQPTVTTFPAEFRFPFSHKSRFVRIEFISVQGSEAPQLIGFCSLDIQHLLSTGDRVFGGPLPVVVVGSPDVASSAYISASFLDEPLLKPALNARDLSQADSPIRSNLTATQTAPDVAESSQFATHVAVVVEKLEVIDGIQLDKLLVRVENAANAVQMTVGTPQLLQLDKSSEYLKLSLLEECQANTTLNETSSGMVKLDGLFAAFDALTVKSAELDLCQPVIIKVFNRNCVCTGRALTKLLFITLRNNPKIFISPKPNEFEATEAIACSIASQSSSSDTHPVSFSTIKDSTVTNTKICKSESLSSIVQSEVSELSETETELHSDPPSPSLVSQQSKVAAEVKPPPLVSIKPFQITKSFDTDVGLSSESFMFPTPAKAVQLSPSCSAADATTPQLSEASQASKKSLSIKGCNQSNSHKTKNASKEKMSTTSSIKTSTSISGSQSLPKKSPSHTRPPKSSSKSSRKSSRAPSSEKSAKQSSLSQLPLNQLGLTSDPTQSPEPETEAETETAPHITEEESHVEPQCEPVTLKATISNTASSESSPVDVSVIDFFASSDSIKEKTGEEIGNEDNERHLPSNLDKTINLLECTMPEIEGAVLDETIAFSNFGSATDAINYQSTDDSLFNLTAVTVEEHPLNSAGLEPTINLLGTETKEGFEMKFRALSMDDESPLLHYRPHGMNNPTEAVRADTESLDDSPLLAMRTEYLPEDPDFMGKDFIAGTTLAKEEAEAAGLMVSNSPDTPFSFKPDATIDVETAAENAGLLHSVMPAGGATTEELHVENVVMDSNVNSTVLFASVPLEEDGDETPFNAGSPSFDSPQPDCARDISESSPFWSQIGILAGFKRSSSTFHNKLQMEHDHLPSASMELPSRSNPLDPKKGDAKQSTNPRKARPKRNYNKYFARKENF